MNRDTERAGIYHTEVVQVLASLVYFNWELLYNLANRELEDCCIHLCKCGMFYVLFTVDCLFVVCLLFVCLLLLFCVCCRNILAERFMLSRVPSSLCMASSLVMASKSAGRLVVVMDTLQVCDISWWLSWLPDQYMCIFYCDYQM